MKSKLVLGIMSGTSIDGVDYALCALNERGGTLKKFWQVKFPSKLQTWLHEAARGIATSHETAQLHHDLGRLYADSAKKLLGKAKPELAGLHGQTIFHHPHAASPATFQLGEPAYLAEALRIPVVSNFRAADVAAGGQGAPLATIFHQLIFGRRGQHVCVNNLGGVSNVTAIDWRSGRQPIITAFDTGPANVLLDLAMRHFTRGKQSCDRDGVWAARGKASETLLTKWLRHPYFKQRPPKSTGRELFGEPFFQGIVSELHKGGMSRFDVLATLTEFTARSLAINYRLHLGSLPQSVILTGGGAANQALVVAILRQLQKLSSGIEVTTCEDFGWPLQSIEPAAFAWLAFLRMNKKPGNLPATTGARRTALLGQVSEP
jgi:anhydro-N-acetylmuramic acid kinase